MTNKQDRKHRKLSRAVDSISGYREWAASYDEFDNPLISLVERVLAQRTSDVAGRAILELGCGTGRNAEQLISLGAARYHGIDNSEHMLNVARARPSLLEPLVRFDHRDLTGEWRHGIEPADLALSSLVLEHIEALSPVFAAVAGVIRPGGQLLVLELHPALHRRGARAHVETDCEVLWLPSFEHTATDFTEALDPQSWHRVSTTDWSPSQSDIARSPKLARYRGLPVLIEVRASRR